MLWLEKKLFTTMKNAPDITHIHAHISLFSKRIKCVMFSVAILGFFIYI